MEDKKELTPAEVDAKLNDLESKLLQLTQERDQAIKERDDLQRKVNGLRIDGITKQVETKEPVEEEPIEFDFTLQCYKLTIERSMTNYENC